MNELADYISEGIAGHGYRNVFDNRLDLVWPMEGNDRKKQNAGICAFAARNGWRVVFSPNGKMATFRPTKAA